MFKRNLRAIWIGTPVSIKVDTVKSFFSRYRRVLLAGLIMAFFLTSCSSGSDSAETDSPAGAPTQLSGTLGAAGGTLTSSDGTLSLTLPAGALSADTEITITEIAADEIPGVFGELVVEKAFNVEPIGLDFATDVKISLTLESEPQSAMIDNNIRSQSQTSDDYWEYDLEPLWLFASNEDLDELEGKDTHVTKDDNKYVYHGSVLELNAFAFGAALAIGGPLFELSIAGHRTPQLIENQFFEIIITITAFKAYLSLLGWDPEIGFNRYLVNAPFDYELKDGDKMMSDSETTEANGDLTRMFTMQAKPTKPGTHDLGVGLGLSFTPTLSFFGQDPPKFTVDITEISPDIEVAEKTPSADSIPTGVYDVQLSGPDGMALIMKWGPEEKPAVVVADENGAKFLSVSPQNPFSELNIDFSNYGKVYGLNLMKYDDEGSTGYQAMLYGPGGGGVSHWVPENNSFGMTRLFAFNENLTDALPYDNDPESDGYLYVDNTVGTIYLNEFNSDSGFFESAGSVYNFPGKSGNAVSAFVRKDGPMLAVMDGTPGKLYSHDLIDLYGPAIYIADLGNSPLRVRSLGEVAVISNHDSKTLTIVSWSQTGQVEITETITVGDGPVGIDLLELSSGNIAIVSTGLKDDTCWVTVVSPAGKLVSNKELPLPDGILGPGHAIWLRNNTSNQILVSGNETDNLAVLDYDLD